MLDGLGLKLIQRKGIAVAFVTARASAAAEQRAAELGVESHTGVSDKLACVEGIAKRMGIDAGRRSPSWATTSRTCA